VVYWIVLSSHSVLDYANATLHELSVLYQEAKDFAGRRKRVENNGLSGALVLVQSLRGVVKQLREKISQAQAVEFICRRKIGYC
jgi:hypothetical protein